MLAEKTSCRRTCPVYSNLLERVFTYTNTHYHTEPRLDIVDPPVAPLGKHDFIISSAVMAHVAPPVDKAVRNLAALLKPGGVLVLTVPFATEGNTIEHFPELYDYRLVEEGGRRRLINRARDGRKQIFDNRVFHGGDGATLEMRLFSQDDLIHLLHEAGFSEIRIPSWSLPAIGVIPLEPFSLPITAIKA